MKTSYLFILLIALVLLSGCSSYSLQQTEKEEQKCTNYHPMTGFGMIILAARNVKICGDKA